jgi:hypothetical protein
MEKFRLFTLEGVPDELQDPPNQKEYRGIDPKAMDDCTGHEQHQRKKYRRNAQRVAGAVDGMLMADGILGDPLLTGTSTEHGAGIIHPPAARVTIDPPKLIPVHRWTPQLRHPLPAW